MAKFSRETQEIHDRRQIFQPQESAVRLSLTTIYKATALLTSWSGGPFFLLLLDRSALREIPQHCMQNPAIPVVINFHRCIDPDSRVENGLTICARRGDCRIL